ncbi:hypothetical protein EV175_006225, partial [Coemansia sp. RSA 1933]
LGNLPIAYRALYRQHPTHRRRNVHAVEGRRNVPHSPRLPVLHFPGRQAVRHHRPTSCRYDDSDSHGGEAV